MSLEAWWNAVGPETRAWLVAHNGEPLPPDVVGEITAVSGPVGPGTAWATQDDDGLRLSDDAVDWVESVANGEDPSTP